MTTEKNNTTDTQIDSNECAKLDAPSSSQGSGERADINLGHACNNRCVFCMQGNSTPERRKWLPFEKLQQELDYYADEIGLKSLGLLGGEPTLYPDFKEALAYAARKGFNDITINTNGYRFANETWCGEVVKMGLNRFCISVHSHLDEIEDTLSGRKGSMATKLKAVKNLLELQRQGKGVLSISFNAVLNQMNLPTIEDFVDYYVKLGVRDIRFNFIRPEGRAADRQDLVPSFRECMPYILRAVLRNEREWKINLSFGEIPYCTYPRKFFANKTYRRRYIGEYRDRRTHVSSFANPGNDDMSDEEGRQRFVWQDLKRDVLKDYVIACRSCPWVEVCGGVWKNYIAMYGEGEFTPLTIE